MADELPSPTVRIFAWLFFVISVLVILLADEPDIGSNNYLKEETVEITRGDEGPLNFVLSLPNFSDTDEAHQLGNSTNDADGCQHEDEWFIDISNVREKFVAFMAMVTDTMVKVHAVTVHYTNLVLVLINKLVSILAADEVSPLLSLTADEDSIFIEIHDVMTTEADGEESVQEVLSNMLTLELDICYLYDDEHEAATIDHDTLDQYFDTSAKSTTKIWRRFRTAIPFLSTFDSLKFLAATVLTLLAICFVFKPIVGTLQDAVDALENRNAATEEALAKSKARERELKALLRKVLVAEGVQHQALCKPKDQEDENAGGIQPPLVTET